MKHLELSQAKNYFFLLTVFKRYICVCIWYVTDANENTITKKYVTGRPPVFKKKKKLFYVKICTSN